VAAAAAHLAAPGSTAAAVFAAAEAGPSESSSAAVTTWASRSHPLLPHRLRVSDDAPRQLTLRSVLHSAHTHVKIRFQNTHVDVMRAVS
jgi:hypothetical protein